MPLISPSQTLLVDADDTLWENNIYFQRAIAAFIGFLNHHEYTPDEVREALNETERAAIVTRGYGLSSFTASLVECYERLSVEPVTEAKREQVRGFSRMIAEQEIELLPRVGETVAELSTRHKLILMTKGDHAEQADKFARSGLAEFFSGVEVVPEKDEAAYRTVTERHRLDPRSTWMLGNSIKSDINPSLAAGLNAVYLAHRDTWVLEHAELDAPPEGRQLLELDAFARLTEIF